MARKIENNT
ncbi:05ba032c-d488-44d2-ba40-6ea0034fa3d7 [Thermothielavioides terrestris]|uniref:05ba032c-d488-44d2-ba40-6ea0034fa3d7 n=1 Tax=Thermothielavioides terrestris TaxID=2587410 RepID=A0A3S4BQ90_9PEZI|nr:05ba032c-d488-44d2-ba40-6ea0034fa3d7 [Thermothielavioides terrestris]